jgi:predicted metallo-beta-lactamase superfamily hydrolase
MGLDQYLYAVGKDVPIHGFIDNEDVEEITYWRKHADLQGYVASLAQERLNIDPEDFNCKAIELTEEDILAILECSEIGSFGPYDKTTGFFFGQTYPEDHVRTAQVMKDALKYIKDGKKIIYTSDW